MSVLIALALKSLLIAGATLLLLHVTRRRSASERSLIAHLGLVALVVLPLASLALPSLRVDWPEALTPAPAAQVAEIVAPTEVVPAATAGSAPAATAPTATSASPAFDWTPYAYAVPAVALLLLTLLALLRLVALRSRAQVLVDPQWLTALAHAQRRMGIKNGTALLTSSELASPISWGWMRPVILLNDEALEASGEAEAIIAHELAHVVRLDWAKLMLARVATALFWFNPLAWILAREAHQLREEAADDAVLAADIAGTDYAQLLVGIARHECNGLLIGAHGVAPGRGSLRRRVGRVLDGTLARGPGSRSWVAGFAAGMLVMAAPLAALTFAPGDKPADRLTDAQIAAANAPPAVRAAVSGAVSGAVAGATHSSDWRIGDEIARDIDRDVAHTFYVDRAGARPGRDKAHSFSNPVEQAIAWKAVGVTDEYAASIRSAAPGVRIGDDDLVGLKAVGLTPDYIRAMRSAGYRPAAIDDLIGAFAVGVDPAYVRDIARAGYRNLPLDQLIAMRALDVSGDYILGLRQSGLSNLSPEKLTALRAHGFRPGGIRMKRPRPPQPPQPPPGLPDEADQD